MAFLPAAPFQRGSNLLLARRTRGVDAGGLWRAEPISLPAAPNELRNSKVKCSDAQVAELSGPKR